MAGGVERFLGVPYAAPPTGARRWRAPAPASRWTGTRPARSFGPDCLQDAERNPLPQGYRNRQGEDCLYLNLWRPRVRPAAPLPVMVWIHGGAFIMGSGALPDYDGAYLARQGVIVVTINYRLGRFGTFAHPALLEEQAGRPIANYGMMDQIAALQWVRDNARAFGGDPANVTILGESAGASSINFLMTSAAARGLFAKAISQSGGRYDTLTALSGGPDSAAAKGLQWAKAKGATSLAALRALPAEAVLDAPVTVPSPPVLDGRIIVAPTDRAFRDGLAARVPYLVGANDHEQSLLRWLPGAGDALLQRFGASAPSVLSLYAETDPDRERQVARLWGEAAMVEPARWRARQHARLGGPTWLYRFAYVPEAIRGMQPGVGHGDEIPFVLGNPAGPAAARWTEADRAMARLVSGYWVAFARSGNPDHAGAPHWPAFTTTSDRLLQFDAHGAAPVVDFARARLDRIAAALGPADARRRRDPGSGICDQAIGSGGTSPAARTPARH